MDKPLSIKDTSWRDAPTILTTAVGQIPWKVPSTSLVLYWRDVVEIYHEFRYQYALVDEDGRLITFISEQMVGDNVPYFFCKSSRGQVDADSEGLDTLVSEIGEHRVAIELIDESIYRIVGSDYEIDTTGDYVFTPEPLDYDPTIMTDSLHKVEIGTNSDGVIYGLALRNSNGRDVWITQRGQRLTGYFDNNIYATAFNFEPSPITEWQGDAPPTVDDIGIAFTPIAPFSQIPADEPSIEISYQFDNNTPIVENDPGFWSYGFRVIAAGQTLFPVLLTGDSTPVVFVE